MIPHVNKNTAKDHRQKQGVSLINNCKNSKRHLLKEKQMIRAITSSNNDSLYPMESNWAGRQSGK